MLSTLLRHCRRSSREYGTAFFFLRTPFTLKNLNHTYQVFIPKVLYPSSPSDYRPISLSNAGYKVILELLANRLEPLLDGIISPTQVAYVPGRHIDNNFREIYEYKGC